MHPKIKEMISFKPDLWDLVNIIKLRKVSNNFQNQFKKKDQKSSLFLQIKHKVYTKLRKMNTAN